MTKYGGLMSNGSKDSKMYLVSCADTHHDVTDLVNHELNKNKKNLNILRTKQNFSMKQKILNLCISWHILRSCRFVAEVTFKHYPLIRLFEP